LSLGEGDWLFDIAKRRGTDMTKSWLAVITVNGSGSWARHDNKAQAVKNVCRQFKADFGRYYDLKEKPVRVVIVDHTDHEQIWWDETGFYAEGSKERLPIAQIIEHAY